MNINLAQILLGEKDYRAVGDFFRESWGIAHHTTDSSTKYSYRVYISRRCYNLNEIFFAHELKILEKQNDRVAYKNLKEIRSGTFLNQYGLMCKASELAAYYNGSSPNFPHILIIDELAIYGREISRLLEKMANLLVDAYTAQFGSQTVDEQNLMVRSFYSAVDVHIYGKSEKRLLLPKELNDRVSFEEEMSATRWRSFIRNISSLVAHTEGIRNKSYYPLFCIENERLENFKGKSRSYLYHGSELSIYQQHLDGVSLTFSERNTGSAREFLAVPFWNGLPREQAELLLKEIAGILSQGRCDGETICFPHIVSILQSNLSGALQMQFQMVSFLIAVISFFDFAKMSGMNLSGEKAYFVDIDRCAMNFGTLCEIEPEMKVFVAQENAELRQKLKTVIYAAFHNKDKDCNKSKSEEHPSDESEQLLRSTETYFARISDRDGRAVFAMRKMGLTFDALTRDTDVVTMKEYLSEESIPGNEENRIFSMLLLIEDGQISTNVQLNNDEVQLRLKVGECAKFIWPERLRRFLPALATLEVWSERSGFLTARKFREFGTFLEQQDPVQYYGLGQIFEDFLNSQYSCGDKVRDWLVDFLRDTNLPDIACERWLSYPWSGRPWSEAEKKSYMTRKQNYWQWERTCQEKIIEYLRQYVRLYAY